MEIEETMLESEQELTDVSIETETDLVESDDEFEYDEDGNIIIPDVIDDGEEESEDEEESSTDTEDATEDDGDETAAAEEPAEETAEEDVVANTDKARILDLETRLKRLQAQGKDTLKALGVDTDDVLAGLAKLAAEAEGISPEEYAKRQAQVQTMERARQMVQRTEFEKKARADLAELQAVYPETKGYTDIRQIPNLKRFGELRDLGLSPKEAYSAANPDAIRNNVATAVKKQSLQDTKKHLHSAVPKGSRDTAPKMSRAELTLWRELFPELNDKELLKLYKQTEDKE